MSLYVEQSHGKSSTTSVVQPRVGGVPRTRRLTQSLAQRGGIMVHWLHSLQLNSLQCCSDTPSGRYEYEFERIKH
jgi:hypothetical protein